jgi:hypothetical protein
MQAFGEFFGAATLDIKRVGIVSSMTMLIFLLAGGYYVQVRSTLPEFLLTSVASEVKTIKEEAL